MRAAWWWIDRWRKSTAYTDMTAEQQGVYRNLLDELWVRDGVIPKEDRILAQIGGDHEAWPRVREVVLARFYEADGGLRHETHDKVMERSQYQAEKQRRYRERKKNVTGNVTVSPSPSPSPSKDPNETTSEPAAPPVERKRKRHTYTPEFDEFWLAYPEHRRIDKPGAFKIWKAKGCLDVLDDVRAGFERWDASHDWAKEGRQFVPGIKKWLEGGYWDAIPKNNGRSKHEDRQNEMLENIRKATEADHGQDPVQRGDGDDGGGLWAEPKRPEPPNLLEAPPPP